MLWWCKSLRAVYKEICSKKECSKKSKKWLRKMLAGCHARFFWDINGVWHLIFTCAKHRDSIIRVIGTDANTMHCESCKRHHFCPRFRIANDIENYVNDENMKEAPDDSKTT